MAYSMSHQIRVGIGPNSGGAATQCIETISCGLRKTGSHYQGEGMRGTRQRQAESIADNVYEVGGEVVMEPRPDELDAVLLYILPTVAAGPPKVYTHGETLTEAVIAVDKVGDEYKYTALKVNKATFRSQKRQALQLAIDWQGKTESATAFPAITNWTELAPYMHHQGVLTLGGSTYSYDQMELTIDHALMLDRFYNSQTRTDLPEGDYIVTLKVRLPFTSTEKTAFYNVAAGLTGIDGSLQYTNGGYSILFEFGALQRPEVSPVVNARGEEVGWDVEFTSRQDLTNTEDALTITNDTTA